MEEQIRMVKGIALEELKKVLPPIRYLWLINIGKSLKSVVGFFLKDEENKSLAYCLYAMQNGNQNYCVLLYAQVLPAFENRGRATRLITESIPQMKLWGYSHVIFCATENEDTRLLEKLNFKKGISEYYIAYTGNTLLNSPMAMNKEKFEPLMKYVQKNDELSPLVRKSFRSRLLKKGFHVDMDAANSEVTRFFVGKSEEILGYIPFERNMEGDLTSTDIYLSKKKDAYLTIPFVIMDLLFGGEELIKEDTKVYLLLGARQNVRAMEQAFGQPDDIHEIVSYIYN